MFQIFLLILIVFLLFKLICVLGSRINDMLGSGRTFKRLLSEKKLDASVYDDAVWKEFGFFGHHKLISKISKHQRRSIRAAKHRMREEVLDDIETGFYHYIIIFLIASILGLILETIFTLVSKGFWESRVGLVWGPFSPLYGFGAVFFTIALWKLRKSSPFVIFVTSALIGGALEQLTGWGMEYFMNATSWTYAHLPDAITQWIAWRFLAAWGVLGIVWCKVIMPELIYRIGTPTNRRQTTMVALLTIFFIADIIMTLACFRRANERIEGIAPANAFEQYVDIHYDDEFIANRFENLTIDNPDDSNI